MAERESPVPGHAELVFCDQSIEARLRGATVIHVDPRYTRTSAVSHLHVPIRAGADIAFLGGIVNYILENERYFEEYVKHYTNAATIINEDFAGTENLDGVFSGWDPESRSYDVSTWSYAGMSVSGAAGQREQGGVTSVQAHGAHAGEKATDGCGNALCATTARRMGWSRHAPKHVRRTRSSTVLWTNCARRLTAVWRCWWRPARMGPALRRQRGGVRHGRLLPPTRRPGGLPAAP